MALRYTDRGYGGMGPKADDWRSRFPSHARSMDSTPMMGSRPVKLFEPDGKSYWALHHLGVWRTVKSFRDPYSGKYHTSMDGGMVNNPCCWTSS